MSIGPIQSRLRVPSLLLGSLGVGSTLAFDGKPLACFAAEDIADPTADPGERHVVGLVEIELPRQRWDHADAGRAGEFSDLAGDQGCLMLIVRGSGVSPRGRDGAQPSTLKLGLGGGHFAEELAAGIEQADPEVLRAAGSQQHIGRHDLHDGGLVDRLRPGIPAGGSGSGSADWVTLRSPMQ